MDVPNVNKSAMVKRIFPLIFWAFSDGDFRRKKRQVIVPANMRAIHRGKGKYLRINSEASRACSVFVSLMPNRIIQIPNMAAIKIFHIFDTMGFVFSDIFLIKE